MISWDKIALNIPTNTPIYCDSYGHITMCPSVKLPKHNIQYKF